MLQGAYGWRLSPTVKAYRSYEKWDPPPDPEHFQVRYAVRGMFKMTMYN